MQTRFLIRALSGLLLVGGCGVVETPSASGTGAPPGGRVDPIPPAPPSPGPSPSAGTGGAVPAPASPEGTGGSGGSAAPPPPPMTGNPSSVDPGSPATPPPATTPPPPGGPFDQGATRDQVIVFLHIGHSNMAGRTNTPADLRPYFFQTEPRLWSFHGTNMVSGAPPFLWRAAKEPLSPDVETLGNAGPGMALLRAGLMVARPEVQLVSIGHGQSGMAGGVCNNYKKGGLFYNVVMGPAQRLRGHVTFGAIWTMLGTSERHLDVATQNAFSSCMADIAKAMRTDLGDPEIPFLMSDFEMEATGDTSPDLPYAKIIIQQLRQAQMTIPRSAIIPTDQLGMDGSHHFNLAGYRDFGLRGVQILQDKGWAPWAASK